MPLWRGTRKLFQKQGQHPDTTITKEVNIRSALEVSIRLGSGRKMEEYPFHFIDMCCGMGTNLLARPDGFSGTVLGSPLVALNLFTRYRRDFRAYFCDRNKEFIDELYKKIGHDERILYAARSNRGMLQKVDELIPKNSRIPGAVLCDSNGVSPERGFALSEIVEFANLRHRALFDIILNVNIRDYRRNGGLGKTTWKRGKEVQEKYMKSTANWPAHSLREVLQLFHRRKWMLTEIVRSKLHEYVLVVGRMSYPTKFTQKGFYQLDTPEGQRILDSTDPKPKE